MELPLRQRKRIKTMAHIQAVAMQLFKEKGYREVTIEEIAHVAEVAPATVYRYFETKTGFFTMDPVERPGYDEAEFAHLLLKDPAAAVQMQFAQIIDEDDSGSGFIAGMQFVMDVPEVRAAVLLQNVRLADDIAAQLVSEAGMQEIVAKSFARSVLIGVFTAMEQWHIDGRTEPFQSYVARACGSLRVPSDADEGV